MFKHIVVVTSVSVMSVVSAYAQPRVEVSGIIGWTLSDGVDGDAVLGGDGNIYDRADPKDSVNWGFGVGLNASDNFEVGFLFGQQRTTAEISGTSTRDLGDLTVTSYHPYLAFNATAPDARVRPYLLVGAGATNYGSVSFTGINGQARETSGATQFSTTLGAGVKIFPSPNVGARFGLQWTPTYIKSDAEGWWCDPYWGCYLVGDAQYSHQWQFNGGVTFRF